MYSRSDPESNTQSVKGAGLMKASLVLIDCLKSQDIHWGFAPYGYAWEDDNTLVANDNAPVVVRCCDPHAQGQDKPIIPRDLANRVLVARHKRSALGVRRDYYVYLLTPVLLYATCRWRAGQSA